MSPSPEICGDNLDNDCNGIVDDGCPCTYTKKASTPEVNNQVKLCCDAGDKLESFSDCGQGKDHGAKAGPGSSCATGWEGSGNYGFVCVKITCGSVVPKCQ